jgi:prepilin-type N-terminal cleavage/methylation domain-containing protein/prepilin-type processing-associated H-X9-DG protein
MISGGASEERHPSSLRLVDGQPSREAWKSGVTGYSVVAMKKLSAQGADKAFTLIELLVVVAIIAVLAAMLIQVDSGGPRTRARLVMCKVNLRQIGLNFITWQDAHKGLLPMQVPVADGGSRDFVPSGAALPHFQVLTNSGVKVVRQEWVLTDGGTNYQPRVVADYGLIKDYLHCSADTLRYQVFNSKSLGELSDAGISYFVGLDALPNNAGSILAGDRNLELNGQSVQSGLATVKNDSSMGWTKGLHSSLKKGNLLFADGHVVSTNKPNFIENGSVTTKRLAVP